MKKSILLLTATALLSMGALAGCNGNNAARKREALKEKAQEAYYEKHPEERPVPPEPGKPEPTELDYLKRIAEALDKKK